MNNKECEYCITIMEEFVSTNGKKIYMCPYCGSLYLPVNTRNNNVDSYEASYGGFIASKCYGLPTQKQMSYLKYLTKELNYEIDLTKITKYGAIGLITELKSKLDEKEKLNDNVIKDGIASKIEEEYAMNHQFIA